MIKRKVILWVSFFVTVFLVIVVCLSTINYVATVSVGGKVFIVEVAETKFLQEKGLSGHKPLANNEGMLFIFKQPGIHGFWMKDMLFPIDIIWIDENLKVVDIKKSVSPETYPEVFYPSRPSSYVLEINASLTDTLKINVGDEVRFTKKWF